MDSNYISGPSNFQHMEGNSVDFRKTFDLNGTNNDEMLRLYLRKAGLSDDIECLTSEQRRAFIYDIIRSNKMPGYWMPSTMKTSAFNMAPPIVRPPPPPSLQGIATSSPQVERRNSPTTPTSAIHYATMSTSSSSSSLQSLGQSSPIVPHRFIPSPVAPPSPTTFVTNSKGSKYEISGPINFQHISGDMTRDMTRKAFDLSTNQNDNVLKKYMIERGITDDEISGMRKQDVIRNIVQSQFTWMPPKRNTLKIQQNLVYATISNNNELTPPTSPEHENPTMLTAIRQPTPPAEDYPSEKLSNFELVTSRFADPSEFPSPNALFAMQSEETDRMSSTSFMYPPSNHVQRPAPPPRKSRHAPPPPSVVIATQNSSSLNQSGRTKSQENLYATVSKTHHASKPSQFQQMPQPIGVTKVDSPNYYNSIPNPSPPIASQNSASLSEHTTFKAAYPKASNVPLPPPQPAMQNIANSGAFVPPPPPPMPIQAMANNNVLPPPPPPMPNSNGGPPPPPPMPALALANNSSSTPIPPPPPVLGSNNNTTHMKATTAAPTSSGGDDRGALLESIRKGVSLKNVDQKAAITAPISGGDDRGALLESIRNGVSLKKVDQKAATISGIKPRAEPSKPPVNDFLSELKLGITLRRVKHPADNPFSEENTEESHA